MIPTLSIVFMAISALVSIGLPIALGIIWHKRTGAKASSSLIVVTMAHLAPLNSTGSAVAIIRMPR